MFFVCSLPKSRLSWISVYLTYGPALCHYYGLRNGIELETPNYITGNADPGNTLAQDKLIERYPDAKWIIVERSFNEVSESIQKEGQSVAGLPFMQTKLEELRAKVNPMVVPYDLLDESILDIARFVNPDFSQPKERHELLTGMNIHPNNLPKPTKEMSGLVEPVVLPKTCQEYLAVVKEMCADDYAYLWVEQLINAGLVWDHIYDGDLQDKGFFDRTMNSIITEWPLNPFLRKYAEFVIPTLVASITAWKHSYNGGSKELAYEAYSAVPAAIAFVLGGNQRVQKYMPRIRELSQQMCNEDMIRDGGKL